MKPHRFAVCDDCGRVQRVAEDPSTPEPGALTKAEMKIIGWSDVTTILSTKETWLCPLHVSGGISRLGDVVKRGLAR